MRKKDLQGKSSKAMSYNHRFGPISKAISIIYDADGGARSTPVWAEEGGDSRFGMLSWSVRWNEFSPRRHGATERIFKRKSVTVSPCLCVGSVLLLSQATTPAWTLEHFEADLLKT